MGSANVNYGVSSIEGALALIDHRLTAHPEEINAFADVAWELLARIDLVESSTMALHHWQEIAKRYRTVDAVRLATLILEQSHSAGRRGLLPTVVTDVLLAATQAAPQEIWPVARDALLRQDDFGLGLRLTLRGRYIAHFDLEEMIAWARANQPIGPVLLANLCPVGSPLAPLARRLLIEFGVDKDVGAALHGGFMHGSFSGPLSHWYRAKLHVVEQWLSDPAPEVQEWAFDVQESLEERLREAMEREEDSGMS